jgi:hypothetical protein
LNEKDCLLVNAALSYLVLPTDIIPDNEARGYLDDLYIVAYTLQKLMNSCPKYVLKHWDAEDINEILTKTIKKTERELGSEATCNSILRLVGANSIEFMLKQGLDYHDEELIDPDKLDARIIDLMMLLKFVLSKQGVSINGLNAKLRNYRHSFNDDEWEDVVKILQEVAVYDARYDNAQERQIDELKRKVLLELNLNTTWE